MSLLLSETFDNGQAAFNTAWTNGSSNPLVNGGVVPTGQCLACGGNNSLYRQLATSPTISIRAHLGLHWYGGAPSGVAELFWPGAPGVNPGFSVIMALGFCADGQLAFRWNSSPQDFSGTTGLYPTDGTIFTCEYSLEITGLHTLNVIVRINNVQVWVHSYNWSVDTSTGGITHFFGPLNFAGNSFEILPFNVSSGSPPFDTNLRTLIDNLEVDDSLTPTTMTLASIPAVGAARLIAVVTGLVYNSVAHTITATCTNLRTLPAPTLVDLQGPGGAIAHTVVSMTSTQIVLHLTSPFVDGNYCLTLWNFIFCWETGSVTPSAFCADLALDTTPPTIICTPQTSVMSPAKNVGCKDKGVGFIPTYVGASGVMPVGADPIDGERLTGKRALNIWAETTHTRY